MSPKKAKARNLMDMVPEHNQKFEKKEDGIVDVLYPRLEIWLLKWLKKRTKKPYHRVKLDKIGSYVWLEIDGKRTVYEIGKAVCQNMNEKEDEMWYRRIGMFVEMLSRGSLIKLRERGIS